MNRATPIIIVACLLAFGAGAQPAHGLLQDRLANLLEAVLEENEAADVEQLLDELQFAREHPINLATATFDDFSVLFFLEPTQGQALIDYRDCFGPILSGYELSAVPGFSPELAELTAGFLTFPDPLRAGPHRVARAELLVRASRLIEEQEGFENGRFEGVPEKYYLRGRYTSKSLRLGYTGEKDAGESFFGKSNRGGFDFNSAFLRLGFGRRNSSVIAGDYVVQWGQGLLLWQGFALSKSAEADRVARFNPGIKPYSSTDENNFMRGLAVDWRLGRVSLQFFGSYKPFDANTDSLGAQKVFTSFQSSGQHRTLSETDDKNSVKARVLGARLAWQLGTLSFNFNSTWTGYEFPLLRADDLYNRNLFGGRRVGNIGADYRYAVSRLYFFGEVATGTSGGWASINGFQFQPVDEVSVAALYRHFGLTYNSAWASAFAENSRVNDEQGFYFGLKAFPARRLSVSAYIDRFRYRWVKYTTAAPGEGYEAMLRTDFKLAKGWNVYARYFFEEKPVKVSSGVLRQNIEQRRQSVRLQLSGQLAPQVGLRTRFEKSFYSQQSSSGGFLVSQDVLWQRRSETSAVDFRVAYFDTDDYDSRIYTYENDLLYQFSVPAFYGEGIRSYLNIKVKVCEKIDFWLKGSRTWYFGVTGLGSGDTAIDGNTRSELKLQVRFRM